MDVFTIATPMLAISAPNHFHSIYGRHFVDSFFIPPMLIAIVGNGFEGIASSYKVIVHCSALLFQALEASLKLSGP
jgi:hypothetical protein